MTTSEDEDESDFKAMWGDMGIAHFFINRDKLIKRTSSDNVLLGLLLIKLL